MTKKIFAVCLLVLIIPCDFRRNISLEAEGHKVFVALGFHVNLRHSFRNDTNSEVGFGQDISANVKRELIAYANPPLAIMDKERRKERKAPVSSKHDELGFKAGETEFLKWPRLPLMFKLRILLHGIFEKAYFFFTFQDGR